jgi:hypothetical protein
VPKEWLTQNNYRCTHSAGYITTKKVPNNLDNKQIRKKGGKRDPSISAKLIGPAKERTINIREPAEDVKPR